MGLSIPGLNLLYQYFDVDPIQDDAIEIRRKSIHDATPTNAMVGDEENFIAYNRFPRPVSPSPAPGRVTWAVKASPSPSPCRRRVATTASGARAPTTRKPGIAPRLISEDAPFSTLYRGSRSGWACPAPLVGLVGRFLPRRLAAAGE